MATEISVTSLSSLSLSSIYTYARMAHSQRGRASETEKALREGERDRGVIFEPLDNKHKNLFHHPATLFALSHIATNKSPFGHFSFWFPSLSTYHFDCVLKPVASLISHFVSDGLRLDFYTASFHICFLLFTLMLLGFLPFLLKLLDKSVKRKRNF